MLIHSASQLLTLSGPPQRGSQLGRLGMIEDGGVLIRSGKIILTGKSDDLLREYPGEERLDASGRVVMPGFVDPHTHAVWSGDRAAEFEMSLQGKTYLEIMEAGGGILSTVGKTRAASLAQLKTESRPRLEEMFVQGTTTVEAKTGYGLDYETEVRMLQALLELNEELPIEICPTFLAAHAVPPEFEGDSEGYTDLIVQEMLPDLQTWWKDRGEEPLLFVDVFCETGAFNLAQSRKILEAARDLGFPLKIHADEFDNLGGAHLAAELGAVSADHLVVTSPEDIQSLAESETVAVGLPCTPFGLAEGEYTPARKILASGGLLAVATDLNPGTAWGGNMQFVLALACRYMRLTPREAIAAATINAAAAVRRQDRIGSLEPGKQADLIILDVDDYRHLGYRFGSNLVHTVIKKGNLYQVKE
ncbi:MAG: imidazolonepropionase [Anaerolineales bacterium]|nr:imidazolonepropionase [Anaerolineales bacterium]